VKRNYPSYSHSLITGTSEFYMASPSEKLYQQYSKRVYVTFHIQLICCQVLRIQVPCGSFNLGRNMGSTSISGWTSSRETKVSYLSTKGISDQDVGRFDISMNNGSVCNDQMTGDEYGVSVITKAARSLIAFLTVGIS
jgi:hypothetical protein